MLVYVRSGLLSGQVRVLLQGINVEAFKQAERVADMASFKPALVVIFGILLLKKSLSKPLTVEASLTLQHPNTAREREDIVFQIQLTEDHKDIIVNQKGISKKVRLEELCPLESDCEHFLFSVKFFLLELAGTFAGLSWGAWSTLVFSINQINSEQ